jgi:adenylate cyclase
MSLHYYQEKIPFQVIPIATALKSAADLQSGKVSDPSLLSVNPLEFKDKILILGASAAGLEDLKPTPVDPALPGFFLHATAISNLLLKDHLHPLPAGVSSLFLALGILLIYGILFSEAPLGLRFGIPVGFTLLYSGAAVLLFQKQSLHLELGKPLVFWLMAGIDSLAYLIFVEGREKKRLKETLGKYLPPSLADELIRTGQDPHAEVGSKEELSILFSDIRGFTTLSEALPPERLVQILNQYLGRMTETVFRHQGTLDKFIGDAVMAFWGAPVRNSDHALLAVRTAVDMRSELKRLNQEWEVAGISPLAIGIGINTGEVIVGNIGSEQRLDYTVIGDQVNLSSRLEGLTKQYHLEIILGPKTEERIRDHWITRPVDQVKVKGKQIPVRIHEPLGPIGGPEAPLHHEVAEKTRIAFELYLEGRFKESSEIHRSLQVLFPEGAGLSQVFLERCATLEAMPPSSWDGIFEAKEK